MKLNFKKIVPVLTGAILLGSTIGFASSAAAAVSYPTTFSDATVVIGSALTDSVAANDIAADLGKLSASTSLSGENVKIETSSNNLNVGDMLNATHPTSIDSSDLPSLLAKGTFQASGSSYDYEQEIALAGGMTFTNVQDDDLSENPVVGVELTSGQSVVNYTLSFTKNAESDIESGHMVDFEDTEIEILGKSYTILNAYNGTNVKLELMGGAVNDVLEEGAKKDYVVNGKTYSVEISYVGESTVKLIVNGESTSSLETGESYTLKDETELGVRDILYSAKTGSASKVEITLGAEKLVLENGQEVEMAGETVDGLTCTITNGGTAAEGIISAIKLAWATDDKAFISNLGALEFPGLKSFKIQSGDLSVPMKEAITIKNNGDEIISITFPFEGGVKTFDLLYGNETISNFTGLGKNAENSLVRSTGTTLVFDEDTDQYFVATYVSGTTAESYLLEAKTSEVDDVNYTSVKDVVTGEYFCEDKKPTQTCKVGSIVLTVNTVDAVANNVTFASSAGTFDRIVTKEGLEMLIPAVATTDTTKMLQFVEEDKYGNIASGATFNVTVGWTSADQVQVSSVSPSILSFQMGDSEKYVAYVASDLATKLSYDKSGDQDFLEIEYHGEEVIGNVWITAPGVVAGSALVVKDSELTAAQKAGDLVVVGGPAVNSVAAELLGLAFPTYGTDAASGFSLGMAQITPFEGKLSPGSVALLVAGYEKDDTSAAAKALIAEHKFGTLKTTSASAYTYA